MMLRSCRFLAYVVALACLSGCEQPHQKPQPVPVEKPVARYDSSDVLQSVYRAKLALNAIRNKESASFIDEAKARVDYFNNKRYGRSDLLIGLTYLNHGALSELFVPSMRNDRERYAETREVLMQMKEQKLVPLDYRLVSFNRNAPKDMLVFRLERAEKHLTDGKVQDDSEATILANQELDALLKLINPAVYEGESKNRVLFHAQAGELFLRFGHYDLARRAHEIASSALRRWQAPAALKDEAEAYAKRLDVLDSAISKKDPGVLDQIGQTLRELM